MTQYGILSDHFQGAGAKYLAEVEINSNISNQHEFQGVGTFRKIFGTSQDKVEFPATFYWLNDEENAEPDTIKSFCTWSDVRKNNPNRSAEYRLYYSAESETVVHRARAGDLLLIAMTKEQNLHIFLCPSNTTIEQQLLWLFGLNPDGSQADVKPLDAHNSVELGLAAHSILDIFGIEFVPPEPNAMDELISRYGNGFPTIREFSQFARDTLTDIDPLEYPDQALVSWMEHTEQLFYHLEQYLISERLRVGFVQNGEVDVESFIEFSKSIHNRRRSRAGGGLEYHIEALLKTHKIRHSMNARTEGNREPDFLFPGKAEYDTSAYDVNLLTMLGAKRTCKDRWRQVLSEARKIRNKHLLTLQPSISVPQTEEMQTENLQLVVPRPIFVSYRQKQQEWLMDVNGFIELVKERQQP